MDDDNNTDITPESVGKNTLRKIEHRSSQLMTIAIILLVTVSGFNVWSSIRLQQVIDENNTTTVQARKVNIQRQNELKDYIKCVLLIRFDVPPDQLSTRKGAEKALDICATNNTAK